MMTDLKRPFALLLSTLVLGVACDDSDVDQPSASTAVEDTSSTSTGATETGADTDDMSGEDSGSSSAAGPDEDPCLALDAEACDQSKGECLRHSARNAEHLGGDAWCFSDGFFLTCSQPTSCSGSRICRLADADTFVIVSNCAPDLDVLVDCQAVPSPEAVVPCE